MLKRYIQRARAFFATGAKTVGLSPKVLATAIAAAIAAIVNTILPRVGLTLADVAAYLHTTDTVIVGAELVLAGSIAGWLLSPGTVAKYTAISVKLAPPQIENVNVGLDVEPPLPPAKRPPARKPSARAAK